MGADDSESMEDILKKTLYALLPNCMGDCPHCLMNDYKRNLDLQDIRFNYKPQVSHTLSQETKIFPEDR